MADDHDSEPVPKLPRGRGLKFSGVELSRIAITLALLVALVVLTKPCSHAVSTFVMGFDGSAAKPQPAAAAGSNAVGSDLIPLRGLDEAQLKATVERAQHRRPAKSAVGSAGSAGSAPQR
ncbi:MAG TPA: hypothetical protein VH143_10670 [Kofleriaceae bacterium]|nr:hypothetical protein [Kofleriaceae bacterium]